MSGPPKPPRLQDRVAVIIVREGRLLLFRRFRDGEHYYALPGGKIEPGESIRQAALREIKEETGLDVTLGGKLCAFENQGRMEYYLLAEKAEGEAELSGPELLRQSPENQYALEWVPLSELGTIALRPARIREELVSLFGR